MFNQCFKLAKLGVLIFLVLGLSACHGSQSADTKQNKNTIKITPENFVSTLYYSGNLLPAQEVSVISPNDGVVTAQDFNYGQVVKKDQKLFVIDSSKQASDFEEALSGYLKAKETLNNSLSNWQNTQMLYSKGLVSRNEFTQTRSQYYTDELAFLQSQQQLQHAVRFYKSSTNIFSLTIEDIHKISQELHQADAIKNITVVAPADGIALFPLNNNSGGDSSRVTIGSEVKQGQLLLTVGHTESLKMKVQANQVDIDRLKVGLPVVITSMAFPNVTLNGSISNIDAQATMDSNSMPVFNMEIIVPQLPLSAKSMVKIGMSAKAAVIISEPNKIMIPISSVLQQGNNAYVKKIVNGKSILTLIQTGTTTEDSVEVTKGLKAGDEIAISH